MGDQDITPISPKELRLEALEVLERRTSTIDIETYDSVKYSEAYTDLHEGIDNVLGFNVLKGNDLTIRRDLGTIKIRVWHQLCRLEQEAGLMKVDS